MENDVGPGAPATPAHHGGCSASAKSEASQPQTDRIGTPVLLAEAPRDALLQIARRHGTPTFAYDIGRVGSQIARLKASLPHEIDLLYSLKANPSLGVCDFIAGCGLGADVASAGELMAALKAGFASERIFVNGPYKSPQTIALMRSVPRAILSVDSPSELEKLADVGLPNQIVLRLRPDYASAGACGIGQDSRFGIALEELPDCRAVLARAGLSLAGFHVFSGSQVIDASAVTYHLRNAMELSLRAADAMRIKPKLLNLGGGFGIPYGINDRELDLTDVGRELRLIADRARPARVVIELGRYITAQCGWYLTAVAGRQSRGGRQAVVVDGGVHHRSDICGLGKFAKGLPPIVLGNRNAATTPTDVLGCLCLPHDILVESSMLPALAVGDILAFANSGAYSLSASPLSFLSHPLPAEVAFSGMAAELIRPRQTVEALLDSQLPLQHLRPNGAPDETKESSRKYAMG
jgi:diaminopimelate decarboxylase